MNCDMEHSHVCCPKSRADVDAFVDLVLRTHADIVILDQNIDMSLSVKAFYLLCGVLFLTVKEYMHKVYCLVFENSDHTNTHKFSTLFLLCELYNECMVSHLLGGLDNDIGNGFGNQIER
jgi:hypothetical protein